MNTAVLYAKTFKKYKKEKCQNDDACIYKKFDGQEYFNKYILNTKGKYIKTKKKHHLILDTILGLKSLFGKIKTEISLDCYGDSMPRYAVYQLQTQRLVYKVAIKKKECQNNNSLTENRNLEPQH